MFPHHRLPHRHPFFPQRYHAPHQSPIFNYFKNNEGKFDFDKISKSINEANKLIGQIDPLIKQLNSWIKR